MYVQCRKHSYARKDSRFNKAQYLKYKGHRLKPPH